MTDSEAGADELSEATAGRAVRVSHAPGSVRWLRHARYAFVAIAVLAVAVVALGLAEGAARGPSRQAPVAGRQVMRLYGLRDMANRLKVMLGLAPPPPPAMMLTTTAPAAAEDPYEDTDDYGYDDESGEGGAGDTGEGEGESSSSSGEGGSSQMASSPSPPPPAAVAAAPAPSTQCSSKEACLQIVDTFLDTQPRSFGLLQARSAAVLEQDLPGPCPEGPAKCRHDSYDNAIAAIYYTKRGKLDKAREILDAFIKILYPASLANIAPKGKQTTYTGVASQRSLTLLASSYNSQYEPQGGNYQNPYVTDGGVDAGNNAWAALAFAHYAAASQQACYATIARDILGAIKQAGTCSDSLQGFMGHYEPYPANYRSVEHNVDIFGLGTVIGDNAATASAQVFVRGMFGKNPTFPTTYATGTGDAARCDPGVAPGFPVAVDATFWNILSDADPTQANIDSALKYALQTPGQGQNGHPDTNGLWVTDIDTLAPDQSQPKLSGFRFSSSGNGAQWENTAGAVMAMVHYKDKYGAQAYPGLDQYIEAARGSIRQLLKMYNGVPSSVVAGTYVAWQSYSSGQNTNPPGGSDTGLGWPYLRYTAPASTGWAGLLLLYQADSNQPVDNNANPYARPSSAVPAGTDASCLR